MLIFIRLAASFALVFSAAWTWLPGGLGVNHFRDAHPGTLGDLAQLCWWVLLLAHPLAIYRIWTGDSLWLWLGVIIVMPLLFFPIFARDVSTR